MPSAFSVLAESPAKRRARRVARLQAQAAAEDILANLERDDDEHEGGEQHDMTWPLSTTSTTTSTPVALSPDERRRAFRDASRRQRSYLAATSSNQEPVTPAPFAAVASAPAASPFAFMGQMGAAVAMWAGADEYGETETLIGAPGPASGLLGGVLTAAQNVDRITQNVQQAAQNVQHAAHTVQLTLGDNKLSDDERQRRVIEAMIKLPMRHAFQLWVHGIAERREKARRFKLANAQGVRQYLLQWRLHPRFTKWMEWARKVALMKHAVYMMKNSDRRCALNALMDNANEVRTASAPHSHSHTCMHRT